MYPYTPYGGMNQPFNQVQQQQYPQIGGVINQPSQNPDIARLVQQAVQAELAKHGIKQPEPFDLAKFGQELLIKVGDALPQEKALFVRDNLSKFTSFVGSEQGKEMINLMADEFKAYVNQ